MHTTTLFTIGHSNRSVDEFIALLGVADIETLIDIRAHPQSGRFPHFNQEALRESLNNAGITYHWAGRQLGGRRDTDPASPNMALAEGLRGFADYMASDEFAGAATQLMRLAAKSNSAIMCAEADANNCHRSLLSDYLILQGHTVKHIVATKQLQDHQLSKHARRESAQLIYDRFVNQQLDL